MQQLNPSYLSDIANQIGFLSAFLGGFAATMLATLLQGGQRSRVAIWAISACAFAATAFIVSVIGCTQLVATLHPDAPSNIGSEGGRALGRALAFISFAAGAYALLLTLALSGWMHSRGAGLATTTAALLGVALVSLAFVSG